MHCIEFRTVNQDLSDERVITRISRRIPAIRRPQLTCPVESCGGSSNICAVAVMPALMQMKNNERIKFR